MVSTSRCGRDNPGSNPGHGSSCDRRCHGTAEQDFFQEKVGKSITVLPGCDSWFCHLFFNDGGQTAPLGSV